MPKFSDYIHSTGVPVIEKEADVPELSSYIYPVTPPEIESEPIIETIELQKKKK